MKNTYTLLLGAMTLSSAAVAQDNTALITISQTGWHRIPRAAKDSIDLTLLPENMRYETIPYEKTNGSAKQHVDSTFNHSHSVTKIEETYIDAAAGLTSLRTTSRLHEKSKQFRFVEMTELKPGKKALYSATDRETRNEAEITALPHLDITLAKELPFVVPSHLNLRPKRSR